MIIKQAKARKIFNFLGQEIIEVEIKGDNGNIGIGSCDLDLNENSEVKSFPKKVDEIVEKFNNQIGRQLINININDFNDFEKIERAFRIFDVTKDLSDIGGNVVISTEYAILRALSPNGNVAKFLNPNKDKFPAVIINIIGGGKYSFGKGLDFQEFLIIPNQKTAKENEMHAYAYDYMRRKYGTAAA